MQLAHIELSNLSISSANMRHAKRAPDVSDLLPSVRARGILQPLLVQPGEHPGAFGIVAGRRRYFAAKAVEAERGSFGPVPCGIMEDGDDADALEASLIENLHRCDPDEMQQYETFSRLILKEGRSPEDVAAAFGLTKRQVEQRMALGNLLPKIRDAYRAERIDVDTIRHLTMATKRQQQDWLKAFENEDENTPYGDDVKHWLCGGQSISTAVALFPVADYKGHVIADLFGENGYFQDADMFWEQQNTAIAARRDAYLEAGWREVAILERGETFQSWQFEKTTKKNGGKVFIGISNRGEVTFHEGYVSRQEAKRHAKDAAKESATEARTDEKAAAPEVSAALQTYLDLHRHLAVRAALLERPGVALRLLTAFAMCGSRLWKVTPEPQRSGRAEIDASVQTSPAQAAFVERRKEVLSLLELPEGAGLVACHADSAAAIFAKVLALSDGDVRRLLTVIVAESLDASSDLVEAAGVHLGVDMAKSWTPDEAFFDLLRDKSVLSAMVADVAGKAVANANVSATGKVQKQIIRDCLAGANGRAKVSGWLPRWMEFPVRAYRKDGGLRTAEVWKRIKRHFQQ
jgi:ParB family chromosome partitioning protein